MNSEIIQVALTELKPHPFNVKLYNDTVRVEEFEGLKASILEHGVKVPLIVKIDPSGYTIISGHRRFTAATALELTTLPCIVEDCTNEEVSIIEHNRYRKKTMSELMREAEFLMEVETEKSKERKRLQLPNVDGKGGRTTARVAKALGVGGHVTFSKLQKIYKAAKEDPKIALQMEKIDVGEKSINSVYKAITTIYARKEDFGLDLKVYNSWYFGVCDPTLGINHPGRVPGQIVENLIYYYTQPGGFVVDPFGGGGITVDAAKNLKRRALVMDIAPVRSDILKWDISTGFPQEAQGCDLIFMDPPYWNALQKDYESLSPDTCASLGYEAFQGFLKDLIQSAFETLKEGGHLAILMMPQTFKLPPNVLFADWPFECRIFMDEAGFIPVQRVVNQWPTSMWTPQAVEQAKDTKTMLPMYGDIIIGRKVT